MPPYAFLANREIKDLDIGGHLLALSRVGVPYSKDDIPRPMRTSRLQGDAEADPAISRSAIPRRRCVTSTATRRG